MCTHKSIFKIHGKLEVRKSLYFNETSYYFTLSEQSKAFVRHTVAVYIYMLPLTPLFTQFSHNSFGSTRPKIKSDKIFDDANIFCCLFLVNPFWHVLIRQLRQSKKKWRERANDRKLIPPYISINMLFSAFHKFFLFCFDCNFRSKGSRCRIYC